MSEQFFFFNSVLGDEREYDQNQLSAALKYTADSNGISNLDYEDPLAVQRMANGDIGISAGAILIEGYVYINDSPLILPGASYLQGEPRTDRVIVRLDRSIDVRAIHVQIMQGMNNSAAPPELIRADNAYDMGLALIKWDGTTATVEDTRSDAAICGFIRDQYATHADMEAYEAVLSQRMDDMQAVVEQEMQQTQEALTGQMSAVQTALENEMDTLDSNLTDQIAALQRNVNALYTSIDCGSFSDDPVIAAHNASPLAHQNLSVDGNAYGTYESGSLEAHEIDPMSHPNLIIDGNAMQ